MHRTGCLVWQEREVIEEYESFASLFTFILCRDTLRKEGERAGQGDCLSGAL